MPPGVHMTPPPQARQTALDGAPAAVSITARPALPLPDALFGRPVFYGWYIVAVVFVVSAMSMGIQAYTLGTFLKPMTEDLGLRPRRPTRLRRTR